MGEAVGWRLDDHDMFGIFLRVSTRLAVFSKAWGKAAEEVLCAKYKSGHNRQLSKFGGARRRRSPGKILPQSFGC
jgi:hypothetical protein